VVWINRNDCPENFIHFCISNCFLKKRIKGRSPSYGSILLKGPVLLWRWLLYTILLISIGLVVGFPKLSWRSEHHLIYRSLRPAIPASIRICDVRIDVVTFLDDGCSIIPYSASPVAEFPEIVLPVIVAVPQLESRRRSCVACCGFAWVPEIVLH